MCNMDTKRLLMESRCYHWFGRCRQFDIFLCNLHSYKLHGPEGHMLKALEDLDPSVRKEIEALRILQYAKVQLERKFARALQDVAPENVNRLRNKYHSNLQNLNLQSHTIAKEIPCFWLTAIVNHDYLANQISEKCMEVLRYLKDVRVSASDFFLRVQFFFASNPFIKNKILQKDYFKKGMTCSPIEWKDDEKHTKNEDGFFRFFCLKDEDEEILEEDLPQLEKDHEIADIHQKKIVPNAVRWYTAEERDVDHNTEERVVDDDQIDTNNEGFMDLHFLQLPVQYLLNSLSLVWESKKM